MFSKRTSLMFQYPVISRIGDIMPGAIDDCLCLPVLETSLFEDEAWGDFYFGETSLGDNSNVVEHSGGLSSVNDARNMSYGGRSPASEAGSAIYGGLSPAVEVGNGWFVETGNYGKFSPSPIRKAGSSSVQVREDSHQPVKWVE
jgi:hypothetical protein